ncbi:mRNA splicing protein [Paraphaeosphaeria sporulosa]
MHDIQERRRAVTCKRGWPASLPLLQPYALARAQTADRVSSAAVEPLPPSPLHSRIRLPAMPPAQPRKPDVSAAAKERNEYIPSFISKKPFYAVDENGEDGDYLEHQRLQKQEQDSKWYDRGKKIGPAATKYRKGACENCGAMTHKKKDCLSRPRKTGAKFTGKNIEADEAVEDVQLGWDAKRDRWNGYDAANFTEVIEEYNELEEMRKKAKEAAKGDQKSGDEEEDEGDRYDAETDMGRKQATSTRNLRLREDTAKYLLNLDLDSAKYDPKTRSMVDTGATADNAAALVAEEGFMKASGDAAEFERAQRYAWETQERGDRNKVHLQANPTSGELMRKKELQEAEETKAAKQKALMDKYGGQDKFNDDTLRRVGVTENERYVEYDERGRIKGAPKVKAKSKYPEDVLIHNHTSVWGSWWASFQWGYACCHSTVKNSYCTGSAGKEAFEAAERMRLGADAPDVDEIPKAIAQIEDAALKKHVPNTAEKDDKATRDDKRKRTLEEMRDGVTEAEMEEYRRKRQMAADPMANFLASKEAI